MGRAYPQDLRERVMAAADSGTGAYAAVFIFRAPIVVTSALSARPAAIRIRAKSKSWSEFLSQKPVNFCEIRCGPNGKNDR